MAYAVLMKAQICWVPDGANQMSVPSAQSTEQDNYMNRNGGMVIVPGADAPSTANISTAMAAAATALATAFNANIGQITGFATGGN